MNVHHIALITRLELIKRVRSTRWILALSVWAIVLLLISAGSTILVTNGGLPAENEVYNRVMTATTASLLIYFILVIGMTIAGANAASSINGDRTNATLALLQVSPASGSSIVIGKLLASWISAMTFLVVAIPFVIYLLGGAWDLLAQFLLAAIVLSLILLAIAGIGIGLSTLTSRPAGSTVLVFLTIIALFLTSPLTLVILGHFTALRTEVTVFQEHHYPYDPETGEERNVTDPDYRECVQVKELIYMQRADGYWWIALFNPVVIMADSLPHTVDTTKEISTDPNSEDSVFINRIPVDGIEYLAKEPSHRAHINECGPNAGKVVFEQIGDPDQPPPDFHGQLWPWGLLVLLLLGSGFTAVGIKRTRVPISKLGRGDRIA